MQHSNLNSHFNTFYSAPLSLHNLCHLATSTGWLCLCVKAQGINWNYPYVMMSWHSYKTHPQITYKDYAQVKDSNSINSLSSPGKVKSFPAKLHKILSDPSYNDIIDVWSPNRHCFKVDMLNSARDKSLGNQVMISDLWADRLVHKIF
jgi:hypothetical protein